MALPEDTVMVMATSYNWLFNYGMRNILLLWGDLLVLITDSHGHNCRVPQNPTDNHHFRWPFGEYVPPFSETPTCFKVGKW